MPQQVYITLPVDNLEESNLFFAKLGFSINAKFSNAESTCLILNENSFVMLLLKQRFKEYTYKTVADTKRMTESIIGFSADSREHVDNLISKVIEAGGEVHAEPVDHGWLYSRSFYDVDGHQWEAFFIQES